MLANEYSVESLNTLPLWMLEAFCREWRIAVTVEDGVITEILNK